MHYMCLYTVFQAKGLCTVCGSSWSSMEGADIWNEGANSANAILIHSQEQSPLMVS